MEEVIEDDCKDERSRINAAAFQIKGGIKEEWREHAEDKCMTNEKKGGG